MTYTWIYIMLLMFAGSFILQMVPLLFYFEAVIAVNLLILSASWYRLGHTHSFYVVGCFWCPSYLVDDRWRQESFMKKGKRKFWV